MHTLILLLLPLTSLAATFELKEGANFPNSLQGRDFFVVAPSKKPSTALSLEDPDSCRANIAKTVCLVDPTDNIERRPQDRTCLEGGQNYVAHFEALYDQYPPAFQKMFCSLRHIFIEKQFVGTAYAGTIRGNDGNTQGAMMGIRKSVLDESLNLQTWASWKEQLSFGGITNAYTPLPDLPTISTQSTGRAQDFLYFVVAHEFGHIFDFANDVNKTKCGNGDDGCAMAEDNWGRFSWQSYSKVKPESDFPLRSSLCFYWCGKNPLPKTAVNEVYSGLANTNFISTYATRNPMDDFADSIAYYLMAKHMDTRYVIDTKQGITYDIMAKLHSPLFAKKYEYIEKFLSRTDIVYP